MNAIFVVLIATIMRFTYLKGDRHQEALPNKKGVIKMTWVGKRASFMFFFTTVFLLPLLMLLFIFVEFKFSERINKNFKFLESQLGKGIYLLMLSAIFMEKKNSVEVVLCISMAPIYTFDILYGICEIFSNRKTQNAEKDNAVPKLDLSKIKQDKNLPPLLDDQAPMIISLNS